MNETPTVFNPPWSPVPKRALKGLTTSICWEPAARVLCDVQRDRPGGRGGACPAAWPPSIMPSAAMCFAMMMRLSPQPRGMAAFIPMCVASFSKAWNALRPALLPLPVDDRREVLGQDRAPPGSYSSACRNRRGLDLRVELEESFLADQAGELEDTAVQLPDAIVDQHVGDGCGSLYGPGTPRSGMNVPGSWRSMSLRTAPSPRTRPTPKRRRRRSPSRDASSRRAI